MNRFVVIAVVCITMPLGCSAAAEPAIPVEIVNNAEAPDWPKIRAGQGRLGRSLVTAHRLELDYQRKTMRLDAACAGHRVAFDPAWEGEAVSRATTDIGDLTFVWDTGAPMSFIQAALARKIDRGVAANGPVVTKTLALSGKDFGPFELRAMEFVQPEGIDGFIGYDFFAKHTVCVDFPGRAFWIQ
jgi:hypothetical protein